MKISNIRQPDVIKKQRKASKKRLPKGIKVFLKSRKTKSNNMDAKNIKISKKLKRKG